MNQNQGHNYGSKVHEGGCMGDDVIQLAQGHKEGTGIFRIKFKLKHFNDEYLDLIIVSAWG
jgi:hypothetical protein